VRQFCEPDAIQNEDTYYYSTSKHRAATLFVLPLHNHKDSNIMMVVTDALFFLFVGCLVWNIPGPEARQQLLQRSKTNQNPGPNNQDENGFHHPSSHHNSPSEPQMSLFLRQEDEISWWKEKTSSTMQHAPEEEDNAEYMERIMMDGSKYDSRRLNLVEEVAPPNCTAPLSDNNSTEGIGSNSTSTIGTPQFTNFAGIVMIDLVGRLPVPRNEALLLEEALLQAYQNLSTCGQPGVLRNLTRVELIPDLFGFDLDDDGNVTSNETSRRGLSSRRRRQEQLNPEDNPEEYFEWNRLRYLQSRRTTLTRPLSWLAKLSGTCNGCAVNRNVLSNDASRPRRRLEQDTSSPQIRGGGVGVGGSRRRLNNEVDVCDCPGPDTNLFASVLNNTIQRLVKADLVTTVDTIAATPELVKRECGPLEGFFTPVIVTFRACPTQFLPEATGKSLGVISRAYQTSFNRRNLLSGAKSKTCDPFARRITDIKAMVTDIEDVDIASTTCRIGGTKSPPLITIRLELQAECIGCNGTLYEDEVGGSGNNGRHFLRKLQEEPATSDLFPFCYCPEGTTSQGITASEFWQELLSTLSILQKEIGGDAPDTGLASVVLDELVVLSPLPAVCGNGVVERGEACDDGNLINGDACTNICTIKSLTTLAPSLRPTATPVALPTFKPTAQPTAQPTASPTKTKRTRMPTLPRTKSPTEKPTKMPTKRPTVPTKKPTKRPTKLPTRTPTKRPTKLPTRTPTKWPTTSPSSSPTTKCDTSCNDVCSDCCTLCRRCVQACGASFANPCIQLCPLA
jgi:cysteine-rich repeat protein